jgi:hypothetical protein
MRKFLKYTIIIAFSLIMLLLPVKALSQVDSADFSLSADTAKNMPEGSKHALYTGLGYGSNMIYLGSTISRDQPYEYAALTYGYGNELFVSVTSVHLANYNPFMAFFAGTINYAHVFNSWFDMSASFSRYQVASSLTDTLFNSFFYGDMTLGLDWKVLYSKITVGALFSEENRMYFQLKNSRYFQTPEFTKKKLNFSFDPYFNLLFGSLTKMETTTGTVVITSPPFRKHGTENQSTATTKYSTTFGLMEADFGLPVSFNTNRFTIEAEPGYVLPVYKDPDYPGLKGFVFSLSCYFKIF